MEKSWDIAPLPPQELSDKYPDIHPVVLRLLYNRGIVESEDIHRFLSPDRDEFHDPFLLRDMKECVERVVAHIKEGGKIFIYGDYDADGITSSSLLFSLLTKLKADVSVYIPDRASEGYGLNQEAIDKLAARGADLIVTVDTGIRNSREVKYAQEQGMEVIVTDHHIPAEDELPECLILNPHLQRESYPCVYLAGVGVAFKLAQALIYRTTLPEDHKSVLTRRILDLAAVGTVADCVPLVGENRALVKQGLTVLENTGRPGLKALMEVAGLTKHRKNLQAWNIGFQIAPRLNASGRIGEVADAVDLLLAEDKKEAYDIASKLDEENAKRQRLTEEIIDSIEQQLEDSTSGDKEKVIVALAPEEEEWNEGVIGLVAGRICEKYYRPTLVLTNSGDIYKGSGRSIEEFNIIEAVTECSDVLDKYGGHAKACGFSLSSDKLEAFKGKIKKIGERELEGLELSPKLRVDMEIELDRLNQELVEQVESLAPFGESNPVPVFLSLGACIKDVAIMGGKGEHIKFRFNGFWAVAFGRAEEWIKYKIGDRVDIVYSVEFNNFNGNTQIQLKLWDLRETRGQRLEVR